MKRLILLFTTILFVSLLDAQTTVPYRIRMPDSTYSAILIGSYASRVANDTITGSYSSVFNAHVFDVDSTGRYDLWFDAAGGTNYSKDTEWSGDNGKMVTGGDLEEAFTWTVDTVGEYEADEITLTENAHVFSIKQSGVDTDQMSDEAITQAKLANDAVTQAKLADNSVYSNHINTGAVGQDEINANSVGTGEIINYSIQDSDLDTASVGARILKDNTVDKQHMRDDAIFPKNMYVKTHAGNLKETSFYRYIDTEDRGSSGPSLFLSHHTTSNVWYNSGNYERIYFTWMSEASDTGVDTSTNYIQHYDIRNDSFSSAYDIGPSHLDSDVSHYRASIIVSDSGYVIAGYDSALAGVDNHNRGIRIMRSTTPEDVSTMAYVTWLDDEKTGDGGSGVAYGSYPQFNKIGSDIFCTMRYGLSSSNHYRTRIFKSTDEGASWNTGFTVDSLYDRQLAKSGNTRSYVTPAFPLDTDELWMVLKPSQHISGVNYYTHHFLLRSEDGENWYNVDKSHSKDITTEGAWTWSELEQYAMVDSAVHSSYDNELQKPFFYIYDDNPYYVMREAANSKTYIIPWFGYWDGSSWIKKRMVDEDGKQLYDSTFCTETNVYTLLPRDENTLDCFINDTSGVDHLDIWRTTSKGDSWFWVDSIGIDSIDSESKNLHKEHSWVNNLRFYEDNQYLFGSYETGNIADGFVIKFTRKDEPKGLTIKEIQLHPTSLDSMRFIIENGSDATKDTSDWIGLQ